MCFPAARKQKQKKCVFPFASDCWRRLSSSWCRRSPAATCSIPRSLLPITAPPLPRPPQYIIPFASARSATSLPSPWQQWHNSRSGRGSCLVGVAIPRHSGAFDLGRAHITQLDASGSGLSKHTSEAEVEPSGDEGSRSTTRL